jgi:phosphoglycolate phosphatase-like HAD superfamily hydrolase
MKLVVLDIDGTLTQTNAADADCFLRALVDCFSLSGIDTDWSLYTHSTDAGIMEELFQKHFRRSPSDAEIDQMKNSFVRHLQLVHGSGTPAFMPMAGAADFLTCLSESEEWVFALATGGWAVSAQFKLQAANLSIPCPIISSDDGLSREKIVRQAIEASLCFYRIESFSRIVSIGDGIWDVSAASSLGLPFIGIARGAGADRLRSFGVSHLLTDFANLDRVFAALDEALEPGGTSDSLQVVGAVQPQCQQDDWIVNG